MTDLRIRELMADPEPIRCRLATLADPSRSRLALAIEVSEQRSRSAFADLIDEAEAQRRRDQDTQNRIQRSIAYAARH